MTTHLVQLRHAELGRRVAVVEEPELAVLDGPRSAHALFRQAIASEEGIHEVIAGLRSAETISYEAVYAGESDWKLLPALDHPDDPRRCIVTGTGLTHRASAENRDKMHRSQQAGEMTDSLRMYALGVEGGRPPEGVIGAQPEWFYKGSGEILRAHGQALRRPAFADDGGEEPEVVAAYLIDDRGAPWRVGFAAGNEFSDHVMEKKNYLYLAHSKLRECAVGPELVIDEPFEALSGEVRIARDGETVWSSEIRSGEEHLAHSLANLEHHHFKYPLHRSPGQVHLHFLGAAAFSFGAQIRLEHGDTMEVSWPALGRPLRNPLHVEPGPPEPVHVKSLAREGSR